MLVAWIDGACEPINPGGTASYGLVIKSVSDPSWPHVNSVTLFEECKIVGSGGDISNNVAEYSGLLGLLEWYLKKFRYLNPEYRLKVKIYSDSQLLINQMIGKWAIKKGAYVPYAQKARELIDQFSLQDRFTFIWIPREQNEQADGLSKKVLIENGVKIRSS